jgi:hypothetical protein
VSSWEIAGQSPQRTDRSVGLTEASDWKSIILEKSAPNWFQNEYVGFLNKIFNSIIETLRRLHVRPGKDSALRQIGHKRMKI